MAGGRRWLWSLVLIIVACSPAGLAAGATGGDPMPSLPLRVITYNIQHGADIRHEVDLNRTAAALAELQPDIAVLQEVDINWRRSGSVNQPELLGHLLGLPYVYFAEALSLSALLNLGQPAQYGLALFSRYPIVHPQTLRLPRGGPLDEPRVLLSAGIVTPAGVLHVFGTHLTLHVDVRLHQIDALLNATRSVPGPRVLVGDFNTEPGSSPMAELLAARNLDGDPVWTDAAVALDAAAPTFPSDTPRARIDYVFVSPDLTPELLDVTVPEVTASDHRPVVVDFRLARPAERPD
ncbi:MAG TPA: endonuclease/exonuclease/phosphatase family protein [Limnochordia bacterium]|nr:endonuclease/exonuclease/phosphatase family protein [Limnochordia bacterium]